MPTADSQAITLRLRGLVGRHESTFYLDAPVHRVGRSPLSDVWLPIAGVSRHHAVLHLTVDGLIVEDGASRNGTFVAGRRAHRAVVLPGAELRFGPVSLRVETIEDPAGREQTDT